MHEKKRQRYHIGWLAEGRTLPELMKYLATKGFGNHFVAWKDSDQVLSWRKLASFSKQYHLRVYKDGEIRGHYELTPEADPIKHFIEKGEEDKCRDFLNFLGDFVTEKEYISKLEIDTTVDDGDSELTYEDSLKAQVENE